MFSITHWNADKRMFHADAVKTGRQPGDNEARWQRWAESAPAGGGEQRDIARQRLMASLQSDSGVALDLRHLGLRSLPSPLPPHITTLLLTGNQLTQLPTPLPPGLQRVVIDDNPLSEETRRDLETLTAAENYQGPEIAWQAEPADEAGELQQILSHGRELRQAVDEVMQSRAPQTLQPPPWSWKASGLLAGTALLSTGLPQRALRAEDNAQENALAADALPSHSRHPRAVAAEVAPSAAPRYGADAIEKELLSFFKIRSKALRKDKPAKEALAARVAMWILPQDYGSIDDYRAKKLARRILLASGLYGGKNNEPISAQTVNTVIRHWVFDTILQSSLREYIAKIIANDTFRHHFTLSDIIEAVSLPGLDAAGTLELKKIPSAQSLKFNIMWYQFLRDEIPLLDSVKFAAAKAQPIAEYPFLALCAGAEYLADRHELKQATLTDIASAGSALWGEMNSPAANPQRLPYLITPALWSFAQRDPLAAIKALKNKEENYASRAVLSTLESWKEAQDRAQEIEENFADYQQAINAWNSKGKLAEQFVNQCPLKELFYVGDRADAYLEPAKVNQKKRDNAKELYLTWDTPPCDKSGVPSSLTEEYQRLTRDVAKKWEVIDRVLIDNTLAENREDFAFIFSPLALIRPVTLDMRSYSAAASGIGGWAWSNDVFVELDNTDLFVVKNHKEQRIYGLKKGDTLNSGYSLHILNTDIDAYIEHDMLSHKYLWEDYRKEGDDIIAADHRFKVKFNIDPHKTLSGHTATGENRLTEYLSKIHREKFYQALFESGNDKSKAAELFHKVKSVIPFYDCVEGIASGDSLKIAQAIPSCFLDALAFVPVAGQAAALSGKYGLSLAQGIRSGVFKASKGAMLKATSTAVANSIALPTRAELLSVFKNTLRAMDPGLELLYKKSALAGAAAAGQAPYPKARLPGSDLEVSVKATGKDRWVVVDPNTHDAFGKYYSRQGDKLSEITVQHAKKNRFLHTRAKAANKKSTSVAVQVRQPTYEMGTYNQMPPLAGNSAYWNKVRRVAATSVSAPAAPGSHHAIQRLKQFLPPPPLTLADVKHVNELFDGETDQKLGWNDWYAWAGLSKKIARKAPPWAENVISEARRHANKSLRTFNTVNAMLPALRQKDNVLETTAGRFLAGMLDTRSVPVVKEAYLRLKSVVESSTHFINAAKKVDFSNFVVVSTPLKPAPHSPLKFVSMLDKNILEKLDLAIVCTADPEARVILYADNFKDGYRADTGEVASQTAYTAHSISDVINHETTHLAALTGDMFTHFRTTEIGKNNAVDTRNSFIRNLHEINPDTKLPRIFSSGNFNTYINYLKKQQGIIKDLTTTEVVKAIMDDKMLFANIMMNDADTLAKIIRDLAKNRVYNDIILAKREAPLPVQTPVEEDDCGDWNAIILAFAMNQPMNKPEKAYAIKSAE